MVITCSASGCTNRHNKDNPKIHFHRYPFSKPEILKQWIAVSAQENWRPTKNSVLCSEHFTLESYQTPLASGRLYLKDNAVPTLFKYPQTTQSKKRSVVNISISPIKVERRRKSHGSCENNDETYQKLGEIKEEVKESVSEEQEGKFQSTQLVMYDTDSLTLAKLCDETLATLVKLPSTLWGMHVEHGGTFVVISHLSESTSDIFATTDKAVLLEADLVPKVYIRGLKVSSLPSYFINTSLQSFSELNVFLQDMESLLICSGTGISLPASSSEKCTLYLHKKQRGVRCISCSAQRNRLKKSEAQRQRRAGAREEKKSLQNQNNVTLRIKYEEEEEEEEDCDEEMQELREREEDNEEMAYNET